MAISVVQYPLPPFELSQPLRTCSEQAGRTSPKKIVFERPSVIAFKRSRVQTRVNGPAKTCGSSIGAGQFWPGCGVASNVGLHMQPGLNQTSVGPRDAA